MSEALILDTRAAALAIIIALVGAAVFIYIIYKARKITLKLIKDKEITFDYGLATQEEVLEKFGTEVGTIILEERRIVFWKFGWLWAIAGTMAYIITITIMEYLGFPITW